MHRARARLCRHRGHHENPFHLFAMHRLPAVVCHLTVYRLPVSLHAACGVLEVVDLSEQALTCWKLTLVLRSSSLRYLNAADSAWVSVLW